MNVKVIYHEPASLEKFLLKCVLPGNESCHRLLEMESRGFQFVPLSEVSEGRSEPCSPN